MSDNNQNQNQRIGALWSRQAKSSNQKYLSGNVTVNVGGEEKVVKVVVFKNNRKEKDNHPDYNIYQSRELSQTKATENTQTSTQDDDIL